MSRERVPPPWPGRACRRPSVKAARRSGKQGRSGVLGLADVIGWHVAFLPVELGQPPLCVPCDVSELQDLESLIGGHTQLIRVSCGKTIHSKVDLGSGERKRVKKWEMA